MTKKNLAVVLDAGSQYGGLIDRNVRELGVKSVILPLDTKASELKSYGAIIISGGPNSVYEKGAPQCDSQIFSLKKPVLGICYGMQLMAKYLNGKVASKDKREDGPQTTTLALSSPIFEGLNSPKQTVLMSHGDSVVEAPEGFEVTGQEGGIVSAIASTDRQLYGLQFHPEVEQTINGKKIFENFLFKVAKLKPNYTLANQEAEAISTIQDVVDDRDVMLFLSGGVDSTVLAALVAQAILDKKRLHAFHIDTGFMRTGESEAVVKALQAAGIEVKIVDASQQFFNATTIIDGQKTPPLNQVTDPQIKRKIIGDTFMRVREAILKEHGLVENTVLAQGSLRPDLIESGSHLASSKADTIKTHHNDSEAVRELRKRGQVVEPLQELYKDQVRAIGRRLGLPAKLVERQPFPGPGLAIRVICSQERYRLKNHDEIQAKLDDLLVKKAPGIEGCLLPIQTVGVQGDHRSYKYLAGLTGSDDWQQLIELANIIPQQIHDINRVVYVFGSIDNVGITPTFLTPDVLGQLRQADNIVNSIIETNGLTTKLSQVPVILTPLNFGEPGKRSVAIRPFITRDFMTGVPAVPGKDIDISVISTVVKRLTKEVPKISRVLYDLTSKPPGTTEWE